MSGDDPFDVPDFDDECSPQPDSNDLPEIVIRNGEIERIVDETEAVLIVGQDAAPVAKRLFQRGGRVVSIGFSVEPTHAGKTAKPRSSPRLETTRSPSASPRRRSS